MKQSQSSIRKRTVSRLAKQYFKKNKGRNVAASLAIMLTAFLFSSVISLAFNMVSSMQLSMQMQKGSKADGTLGYMTEEEFEQLVNSDFVEKAGHRRVIGYADNAVGHSVELDYADEVQQELTFCTPTHGEPPKKANEIATTQLALKALGAKAEVGASVPLEFEIRGKKYHYDMVVSGWWEAGNDTISVAVVSDAFVKENPDVFLNTYRKDHEMAGTTFSEVVLKDKKDVEGQLKAFAHSVGGNTEDMSADHFIQASVNQMSQGMVQPETILFAVVFLLMFVICGYLLIYNIFDISVMQNVREYGLLRIIGTSTAQIKSIVRRQAVWLTAIGLPIGLAAGYLAGWLMLPYVMEFVLVERRVSGIQASGSPLIFVIAALFTILTVAISTRRPAKKASRVSPLEALRYTEQDGGSRRKTKRTRSVTLSGMAGSNLGRNRRRSAFIMLSMLLCIVLFNSVIVITKSMDEEKYISRNAKTDFTVYNAIALNVEKGFGTHEDAVPQQAVDAIREQSGVKDERCLYRNTMDDRNVYVDYGFDGIDFTVTEYGDLEYENYTGYPMWLRADEEGHSYGNVMGASEVFWEDMLISEGEKDPEVLKQKMQTGEYAVIGCQMDKLTGGADNTVLTDQLTVGDEISFYKDGELVKTCTVLAKAITVGTEEETPTTTTAQGNIGGDAPFVYLPDTVFQEIYDTPTLLGYGFNMADGMEEQMEAWLSGYVEENPTVTYTSTKLLKEIVESQRNLVLLVGGLIGTIMAFAGLVNFTNMTVTNIIARRREFATMQSVGLTNRQLRRMVIYEGLYYAAGAGIIGAALAGLLAATVLKNALNSPSMWFFTLRFTLVPAAVIGVLYLLLAAVIPAAALHYFRRGTVVERLRTAE